MSTDSEKGTGNAGVRVWTNNSLRTSPDQFASPVTSISNIEEWVGTQLGVVEGVVGVAVARCEGARAAVFTMVKEHSDEVYDRVLEREEYIRTILNTTKLVFSIRSVQGRPLAESLPPQTSLVFKR